MGQLECSEALLSDCQSFVDFRIDSTVFIKDYTITTNLLSKYTTLSIKDLSLSIQNFGAYSLCNEINFVEKGIPFLMAQNVRENYINYDFQKFIDEESHKILYKSHCRPKQVLITMAGEYLGKSAVFDRDFVCSSNQAVAKITLKDSDCNYFISTFINTKYGQNQINRLKTATGQPNINMGLIGSLKIPLLPDSFQSRIADMVKSAHSKLEESKMLYRQAEEILEKELGIDYSVIEQKKDVESSVRCFRDVFCGDMRIDSEYYQGKYELYEDIVKTYPNGWSSIGELFDNNTDRIKFAKSEYNYIEIGDVNIGDGSCSYNLVATELLPANAKIPVRKNDLLISKVRPYRGAVSIIDFEAEDLIASGAFCVLRKKNTYLLEPLQILLRIKMYKDWLLKWNVGTTYPVIKDEDILCLPIPLFSQELQYTIAEKVQTSFRLRAESKQLLEDAKRLVEEEIEKGGK